MISIGTQISWKYTTGGWSLNVDGANPLTLKSMSLSKPNVEFNDEQLKIYAKHTIDYLASINDFKKRVEVKNVIDSTDSFSLNDFSYVKPKYLYKYINEKSIDYYKKGQFQVGSIGYFKKMENEKARDELEGLLFIAIQTGNRIANFSLNMGSNFYAFCGTQQDSDSLNDYHRKNFGSILLKLRLSLLPLKLLNKLALNHLKL